MSKDSSAAQAASRQNARGLAYLNEGRFKPAAERFRRALQQDPDDADVLANLANAYVGLGQLDAAVAVLRRALSLAPEDPVLHNNLGGALLEIGDAAGAVACLKRATALAPGHADYHTALGNALHAAGDPAAALAAYEASLRCRPGNAFALAFKGIVLTERGALAQAHALLDEQRHIRRITIEAPEGYPDLDAFNAALAAHVLAHPTLVRDRPRRATKGGSVAGNLLTEPKGPIADLEQIVLAEATRYLEALPPDPADPMAAGCPSGVELVMWGTVLTSGGYQASHNHPNGWLSGVYYPKVPPEIDGRDEARAGWIRFGPPPPEISTAGGFQTIDIAVHEGLLLLFPSYAWHGTLPFESAEPRISIAFDLSPPAER
ncbi:MAG: putative 2OG-Fe(II) oxygenase [Alphaproteobacteria bacterium]|nr:putative 2OG-Fe(II) oxygenase [Alphaproteobacteria bacterium]